MVQLILFNLKVKLPEVKNFDSKDKLENFSREQESAVDLPFPLTCVFYWLFPHQNKLQEGRDFCH